MKINKNFFQNITALNAKQITFIIIAIFTLSPFSSPALSLFLGILSTFLIPKVFNNLNKISKYLLQISVVGLGFGMNINNAIKVSQDGFWLTFIFIFGTLALGLIFGKIFKLQDKTATLITSGTAICGGSAIAAVSPVIEAENEDISVAMGIVFLLNSIALLIFPILGHYFGLSQYQFGLWSAIAIHDTSSVVGAAQSYGSEALKIATTIKLARALWIIPLTVLFAFLYKKKGKLSSFPKFILFFIVAMAVNTYFPIIEPLSVVLVSLAKNGLNLTLFLIGAGLSLENIRKVGFRSILFGLLLWIIILTSSLLVVINFY